MHQVYEWLKHSFMYQDAVGRFYYHLAERLIRREKKMLETDFILSRNYSDTDFISIFRLSKDTILSILENIDGDLGNEIIRNSSIFILNQLLITFRCQLEVCYQLMGICLGYTKVLCRELGR